MKGMFGAALAAALLAGVAVPANAQVAVVSDAEGVRAGELQVPFGKSQVLRVDRPYSKALVGNPEIADVLPLTDRSIYVLGKKIGTTSLTLYDRRNALIAVVDVAVGPDVLGLRRQLSELLPTDKIGARMSNDSIVLDGIVSSAPSADRAVQLASTYAPGKVVNMMSIGSAQQVMLEVRFSEVRRSAAKALGTSFFVGGGGSSLNGAVGNGAGLVPSAGTQSTTVSTPVPGGGVSTTTFNTPNPATLVLGAITDRFGVFTRTFRALGTNFASTLDALETKGAVTTLAEPTLVALSGETASFLAGGEFPIPVSQAATGAGAGGNSITVEFKPFGVSLAFTPTVLADGVINLVVAPEVSSIDRSAAVSINGIVIPGLQTRRAKTTVELRDGESFAMAGLLRKDFGDTVRQFPILGSLPIIGTLFRSTNFQKDDSELVIIVTPRIVRPVAAGSLKVPTDRVKPPSELDLFLNGRTDTGVTTMAPLNNAPLGEPNAPPPPRATPSPGAPGGMADVNPKALEKDYGHVL